MKSRLRLSLLLLSVIALGGCASPLAGTWLSVSRAGHKMSRDERFTTRFTNSGEVTVTEPHGVTHAAMHYTVDGDVVIFSAGRDAEKYRFAVEAERLRLQPLNARGTRPAGKLVEFRKIEE